MASKNTIGSRIVIEGEKEYNDALKRIRTEHAELKSEMKLCTETYRENANSMEALSKKQEILTKQVDAQTRQVNAQKKALESANDAQEKAKERVEKYRQELEAAQKELKRMESSTDATKEALEAQRKEVESLAGKLELSQQGYEKAETATAKYRTALNTSQAELAKLEHELDQTNEYMDEAKKSTDGCAKSIDQYGKKVKDAGDQSEKFSQRSQKAVSALAGALAASGIQKGVEEITKALMECSDAAKTFETSMNKVYTIANENAVAQADMSAQLLEKSTEMIQSANDMADATYNAISAGVDTADAVDFAATSTKLAVGGFTDATTAVDILTTAVNAYNLETEKSVEISDMLVTTQNEGKTTVNELGANMGKVIPLAAAYNVNMANLSTTYAKLTANGIKTAESTTYIKGMLNELGDSGSTVSKILREETGLSFAELMEQGYSLGDVIEILGESVDGNTGAFNELWSSSEAGIGALSLLGTGAKEFNRVLDKMENSAGATDAAFKKMTDSTEYAEKRMNNAIENLKIAIGNELNPALKDMYNKGADAFEWATDFVKEHPEVVKAITVVVATLGTAVVAIGAVTAAVAAFNAVIAVTNPAVLAITAAIGALVGVCAAVSAATAHVDTELEKTIDATSAAAEAVKNNVDAILQEIEANDKKLAQERNLLKSIKELNEKENLSIEEKAELSAQVDTLNGMLEGLNLSIDKQTGHLEDGAGAFEEYAQKLISVQEYEQNLAKNTELYNAKTEAQEALTKAIEEQDEAYKTYLKTLEDNTIIEAFGGVLYANKFDVEAMADAYKQASENVELCQEALQNAEIECQNMAEYLENVRVETEELSTVQVEYRGTMHEVTPAVAADIQELETAYNDAKTAAEDSIKSQVGLFEELSTASDLSAEKMAENLKSQTDAFTQYKDDMLAASEMVKREAMDEELFESIKAMGMEGAGYLHELVTTSKEDAAAYAEVQAAYKEMMAAREELASTMGDLETGYSDQMDEWLQYRKEAYETMVTDTGDRYEEIKTAIEEALADIDAMQAESVDGMVTLLTESQDEIKAASETMMSGAVSGAEAALKLLEDGRSEVFYNLGTKIPESIAQGILDGQETVSSAVQEVIDNAVDNADLSGIAGKIDRQLGLAFE